MLAYLVAWAPMLASGDLTLLATLAISSVGQWFKSKKNIPTVVPQFAMMAIGVAFYIYGHPNTAVDGYVRDACMWAFGLPGMASVSASVGMPKTDSR